MKKRIYEILAEPAPSDQTSRRFDIFILSLIGLNCLAFALETIPSMEAKFAFYFYYIELVSVSIFTVEYIGRLWTCTLDPRFSKQVRGRLEFAVTPFAIIDLIAILPFYLPFFGFDLR